MENVIVKANKGDGYTKFLKHHSVKAVLSDGAFELKVKINIVSDLVVVEGGNNSIKKSETSDETSTSRRIFDNMSNTDFTITCEDQKIPCHKIFLRAASQVFEAMIETKMKESLEGNVDIKCSAKVGRNLVRFIYIGELEPEVVKEEAETFLELGEMFGMETLKKVAGEQMTKLLNTENMVSYFLAGDLYRAAGIRGEAKEFLKLNLRKLKKTTNWKELFGTKKDLIIELMEDFF